MTEGCRFQVIGKKRDEGMLFYIPRVVMACFTEKDAVHNSIVILAYLLRT